MSYPRPVAMRKVRALGFLAAVALVACGLDVVGIDPASPDEPAADGSTTDGRAGDRDTGTAAKDASDDAPVVPSDTGAPIDANECSACPKGTARKVCTSTGCADGYRVFVTSTKTNANLDPTDGLAAGDAKCQALADTSGLGGTWKAWLSSSAASVAERFNKANAPYRLVDGTILANDFTDLTDGTIATDIHLDESGKLVSSAVGGEAWTGTDFDGTYSGSTCNGFTNDNGGNTATVGVVDQKSSAWTAVYLKTCDSNLRLYCFEQ